jgi:hypothetical protein
LILQRDIHGISLADSLYQCYQFSPSYQFPFCQILPLKVVYTVLLLIHHVSVNWAT